MQLCRHYCTLVYMNFEPQPVITGRAAVTRPQGCADVLIGGRSDNFANFEGRIADVAIFRGGP
jgi:hypothetical protein